MQTNKNFFVLILIYWWITWKSSISSWHPKNMILFKFTKNCQTILRYIILQKQENSMDLSSKARMPMISSEYRFSINDYQIVSCCLKSGRLDLSINSLVKIKKYLTIERWFWKNFFIGSYQSWCQLVHKHPVLVKIILYCYKGSGILNSYLCKNSALRVHKSHSSNYVMNTTLLASCSINK